MSELQDNKALWYCVIILLNCLEVPVDHLFKQEPEVLGQVGVEAYMTLAIVASLFGNMNYSGPNHQNDELQLFDSGCYD